MSSDLSMLVEIFFIWATRGWSFVDIFCVKPWEIEFRFDSKLSQGVRRIYHVGFQLLFITRRWLTTHRKKLVWQHFSGAISIPFLKFPRCQLSKSRTKFPARESSKCIFSFFFGTWFLSRDESARCSLADRFSLNEETAVEVTLFPSRNYSCVADKQRDSRQKLTKALSSKFKSFRCSVFNQLRCCNIIFS